jgi:hypothetical protein
MLAATRERNRIGRSAAKFDAGGIRQGAAEIVEKYDTCK